MPPHFFQESSSLFLRTGIYALKQFFQLLIHSLLTRCLLQHGIRYRRGIHSIRIRFLQGIFTLLVTQAIYNIPVIVLHAGHHHRSMAGNNELQLRESPLKSSQHIGLEGGMQMHVNLIYQDCSISIIHRLFSIQTAIEQRTTKRYIRNDIHQTAITVREMFRIDFSTVRKDIIYFPLIRTNTQIIDNTTASCSKALETAVRTEVISCKFFCPSCNTSKRFSQ